MYDYDREYFNRQNAVISELVRQVTSMCDDIQMRLDEMDLVLEEIRVTPTVREPLLGKTFDNADKCDCEYCACAAYSDDYEGPDDVYPADFDDYNPPYDTMMDDWDSMADWAFRASYESYYDANCGCHRCSRYWHLIKNQPADYRMD